MATGDDKGPFQQRLATWVVVSGLAVVGLCGTVAIIYAKDEITAQAAKDILTILLPVVGTWVGSVLAYYFGKENFEAGARQAMQAAGQKLSERAMKFAIPVNQIKALSYADAAAAGQATLASIDAHLTANKFFRTPILTNNKEPLYVIHRQPLDSFLVQVSRGGGNITTATLDALIKDLTFGAQVQGSAVTVPESATLADAKTAMEARKDCQDVFITSTGKANSPILGWLTNNEIQRAASA
jgi:hypothetical protein